MRGRCEGGEALERERAAEPPASWARVRDLAKVAAGRGAGWGTVELQLGLGKDFVDRYPRFRFDISLRLAQMLTDFRVNFGRNPACRGWLKRQKNLEIFGNISVRCAIK